jgi:hypothetical protein
MNLPPGGLVGHVLRTAHKVGLALQEADPEPSPDPASWSGP